MKTNVIVNLQVEGTHKWDGCDIAEVNYLANEHRHVFHIKAKKEVSHGDRQIEIIQLKHNIEMFFMEYYDEDKRLARLGGMSCEMLASKLCDVFGLCYCEVLEDGENGAEVYADAPTEHTIDSVGPSFNPSQELQAVMTAFFGDKK